jgi:hypothetical protein
MSTESETSTREDTCKPSAARIAEIVMRWRGHPDIIARCAGYDVGLESWEAFKLEAFGGGLTWEVPSRDERWFRATHPAFEVGFTDFNEDERAIIRRAHKSPTVDSHDPERARWIVVEDTAETTPPDLPKVFDANGNDLNPAYAVAARAWAAAYRTRLPEGLRHFGMIVLPRPGESPIVGIWIGVEQSADLLRNWIQRIGGGHDDDPGRFRVRGRCDGDECDLVDLEPVHLATDVHTLAARPSAEAANARLLRTGIGELDAQLRLGGLPDGSLVIVQGGPKACKTTTELQLACSARQHGAEVLFIAGDESPIEIQARLWQRQGLAPDEAHARASHGLHADEGLIVADPRQYGLGKLLDAATAWPAIRMIVAESLQTLAPGGQHEIDALLVRLRATGKTVVAASEVVGGGKLGRRAKGSTSIGYQASLTLDVDRKGDAVRLRPMHSRLGTEEPIYLVLDAERQTLRGREELEALDDLEPVKAAIVAAIAERGPLSGAGVERWVRGASKVVRDALAALVAGGVLVKVGTKYEVAK